MGAAARVGSDGFVQLKGSGMHLQDENLGSLKKIGRKLKRVAKKIAKPALHIGAAVATGGASVALSSQMMQARTARKSVKAQRKAEFNALKPDFDAQAYLTMNPDVARSSKWKKDPWGHFVRYGYNEGRKFPQRAQSGSASTAAWGVQTPAERVSVPYTPITPRIAQPASQADAFLPAPANASSSDSFEPLLPASKAASSTPNWLIPVGVGGLLLMFAFGRRGRES
jgi:hypothetical protein